MRHLIASDGRLYGIFPGHAICLCPPPVWGDLFIVLSNIWLVFFALALTVRDKDHIALDLIYSWLPLPAVFAIQQFWSMIIFVLGLIMIVCGLDAVATMGGKYWEMWYFVLQDGGLVFKPNYMPKKYAIAIVPISGLLVSLAAVAVILVDCLMFRRGTFKRSEDIEFVKPAD